MKTVGARVRVPRAAAVLAGLALGVGACSSPTTPTPPPTNAPTLTCPVDLTGVSNDGSPLVVSYVAPTAVGGTAPVSVACSPPSGSSFAPGVTPITCVATDSLSRSGTCGFAVRISVPPKLQKTRFMAYGDSLTEGKVTFAATPWKLYDFPGSYPSVLQALLIARYPSQTITMSKQGNGGMSSSWGLANLAPLLISEQPTAVILWWGANDFYAGDPATIAPAVSNMDQMITMVKNTGATVFVATMTPEVQGARLGAGYPLVVPYNDKLRALATTRNVTLVDLYAAVSTDVASYVGPDGLHLTSAGYQKVADTFFERIRATLETPGVSTTTGNTPSLRLIVPEPDETAAAGRRPSVERSK